MAPQVFEKTASTSDFEVDSQDQHLQSKVNSLRVIDSIRVGLTVLALLMGVTVLGTSGQALNVYNNTYLSESFGLELWPTDFDLRPTVALVAGAAIVTVTNIVSLLFSKVKFLRYGTPVHTPLTLAAPLVGLAVALIAMCFFYAVNANETVDTLISWTCRWQSLNMLQEPHFGTLCKESWAGVYLSILLIPIEAAIFAVAGWQAKMERYTTAYAHARKSPSPVLA